MTTHQSWRHVSLLICLSSLLCISPITTNATSLANPLYNNTQPHHHFLPCHSHWPLQQWPAVMELSLLVGRWSEVYYGMMMKVCESFVCVLQWGQRRCLSVPLVRATPILWHFSKFPEKETHTVRRFSWCGHRESSVLLDSVTQIICFFLFTLWYFFSDFVS